MSVYDTIAAYADLLAKVTGRKPKQNAKIYKHHCLECGYQTHRDHAAAEMVLLRGLNLVPVDNRGRETACAGVLAGAETSSQVPKARKGTTRRSKK
ncbi:MAG: hypothetical protein KME30_02540 [Iphinoe sp. HA4291-MV1]|nr:hypothetical protein [Iphinoe sp. HA4291-MV1]